MSATPDEAEALAKKCVQDYLNACAMESRDQIGNALMKLVSVAGVLMAAAEGARTAGQRLEGTAKFVRLNGPVKPLKLEALQ